MTARRAALAAAIAALNLGSVLVAAPVHADTGPVRVSMKDFAFNPPTVTITAGTAVVWTYDEQATDPQPNCESPYFRPPSPETCGGHSTTSSDNGPDGKPLWDSGIHRADGFPFTHLFTKPGTYHYICLLHGGAHPNNPVTHMNGVIVVTAAPASNSGSSGGGGAAPSPAAGAPAANTASAGLPNTSATGGGGATVALGAIALLVVSPLGRRLRRRWGCGR